MEAAKTFFPLTYTQNVSVKIVESATTESHFDLRYKEKLLMIFFKSPILIM